MESAQRICAPDPHGPGAVVGLDLGGTKMAAALVGADGVLLGPAARLDTPASQGPEAILDAVASLVLDLAASAGPGEPPIAAVGIGTAGVVDTTTGTIISATEALAGWAGTPVAQGLSQRLEPAGLGRIPIDVVNDVDAYATAEAWRGAGRGCSSLLVAAVGTGVGGALVLEGRTRRGAHHVAGEIGHIPAPGAQGETCTCGRIGHLEAVVAGPQIHRRYLAGGGDDAVRDARQVEERALAGEELALAVYRDSAQALGQALAGLASAIDPDRILISGGLARAGDLWWGPLRRAFAAEVIEPLAGIEILPAALGTTAPIIGAARGALRAAGLPETEPGAARDTTDQPQEEP
ncbi:ROK family protein [Actinomyces slackii]|uniref:Glucokinase n=2 Tax=Actinomyces slackii TaxID=52774 RepID=A0A3S4SKH0_9ACTO|nr:ROK family protein [Actinomyces slackii]VEG74809.1 Glucokinase [Actinomyces slackii]